MKNGIWWRIFLDIFIGIISNMIYAFIVEKQIFKIDEKILIFIVSIICIDFILRKIIEFFKNYEKINMKQLTNEEINIIKKFYIPEIKGFTTDRVSIKCDNKNEYVIKNLIDRKIIKDDGIFSFEYYDGHGTAFELNKKAVKLFNKNKSVINNKEK